jgi:hypothetical protein
MRQFWDQFPWSYGLTDKNGEVNISFKYTNRDTSVGSKPPAWRDKVTEKPYVIKINQGQIHEEFSMIMRPGESVCGKTFKVLVLEIQQPRYVKTR